MERTRLHYFPDVDNGGIDVKCLSDYNRNDLDDPLRSRFDGSGWVGRVSNVMVITRSTQSSVLRKRRPKGFPRYALFPLDGSVAHFLEAISGHRTN